MDGCDIEFAHWYALWGMNRWKGMLIYWVSEIRRMTTAWWPAHSSVKTLCQGYGHRMSSWKWLDVKLCSHLDIPAGGWSGGREFTSTGFPRPGGCQLPGGPFTRGWKRSVKGTVIEWVPESGWMWNCVRTWIFLLENFPLNAIAKRVCFRDRVDPNCLKVRLDSYGSARAAAE